jgi:hypothetical protein
MRRRNFLALIGGAGILSFAAPRVDDYIFIKQSGITVDDSASMTDDGPPEVSFLENKITVRGVLRYGSSNCNTVGLGPTRYDPKNDHLIVEVVPKSEEWFEDSCALDIQAASYSVSVTFRLSDPRAVTVIEHNSRGKESYVYERK